MSAALENTIRTALEVTMRAWIADEAANHDTDYAAVRPLPLYGTRGGGYPKGKKRSDCSWGARLVCYWTPAAPDPMGAAFQGGGNSSTICAKLDPVASPSLLLIGDPVTFGWNGDDHATLVLEPGSDPLLWSDGHQGAPNTYRLSWDNRPHQLKRLPVIAAPPSPDDILRSEKGYWSWVAWKLGEQLWRHKKPADPLVRPDVPARIPLLWWRHYARYLRNRDKPNKPTAPISAFLP